jgi:hypothetical protein
MYFMLMWVFQLKPGLNAPTHMPILDNFSRTILPGPLSQKDGLRDGQIGELRRMERGGNRRSG